MDFLSPGTKKVAVVKRWALAEVQLYFCLITVLRHRGLIKF